MNQKRFHKKYFRIIITTLILIFPLILFSDFNTTEYNFLSSRQQIQSSFVWHVGDNYTLEGSGVFSDSYFEVVGLTTWNGKEVYNISTSITYNDSYLEFIYDNLNYHSTENFDLVGYNREYDFSLYQNETNTINGTIFSSAFDYSDFPSSYHKEGVLTRNLTYVEENYYEYYPNQWQTVPNTSMAIANSSFSVISTENISTEVITTPAGTFDCWKVTDYQVQTTSINSSGINVAGEHLYANQYQNYSRLNATHEFIDIWSDYNGTITINNYTSPARNFTWYISKTYGIQIRYSYYDFVPKTDTWKYTGGYELIELNVQPPATTTDLISNTSTTTTTIDSINNDTSVTSEDTVENTNITIKTTDFSLISLIITFGLIIITLKRKNFD